MRWVVLASDGGGLGPNPGPFGPNLDGDTPAIAVVLGVPGWDQYLAMSGWGARSDPWA
jgi:hypothetical protein